MFWLGLWLIPIVVFVVFATRVRARNVTELDSTERAIEIHKARLQQLDIELQSGELTKEEYDSFKLEEQKALLADTERSATAEGKRIQLGWVWVPALSAVTFLLAYGVYSQIGASDAVEVRNQFAALAQQEELNADDVNVALDSYEKLLQSEPKNFEGWFRLARMQMDMQRFERASASLTHLLTEMRAVEHRAEDEATILAYLGQSSWALGDLSSALDYYQQSLQYDLNPTALGMAGRISYEMGNFVEAIELWTQLKYASAEADAPLIENMISQATEALAAQGIDYAAQQPRRLVVDVNLPAAWEGLSDQAALFVYARQPGQRMPVAAKRVLVTSQNMTVLLTESDTMGPAGNLADFEQLEVTARVSLTGIANSQPGDWEGSVINVLFEENQAFANVDVTQP